MNLFRAFLALILLHLHLSVTIAAKHQKVLLSDVQTLTLRNGQETTHRRVSAMPQLKCIGGNARGLYEVDVLRCTNEGASYAGSEDIQWTCTASLPSEFRLGSTDVICEGYSSKDDPYVLKGSCGVRYRLMLTRQGEEHYGKRKNRPNNSAPDKDTSTWAAALFALLFIGVAVLILVSLWRNWNENARRRPRRLGGPGLGWGSGGGGGGGGGHSPYDDPPPPYDSGTKTSRSYDGFRAGNAGGGGWRPGFWTGAAGGAAAGYAAGNWRNNQNTRNEGSRWYDNGEGSSRSVRSSGSSSSGHSAPHESTGFGSTSRR